MQKNKHTGLNITMTVLAFVFIISSAVTLVVYCTPIYYLMVKVMDLPGKGFSFDLCKRNYDVLIAYNTVWGPSTLAMPDFAMSENGAIHFAEVKTIFVAFQISFFASTVLMVIGYVVCKKKKVFQWMKAVIYVIVALIIFVAGGLIFNWENTFVLMHKLLFNNDYWIFNAATDPVINILPDAVFLVDGAVILVIMAAELVISGVLFKKNMKGKRFNRSGK